MRDDVDQNLEEFNKNAIAAIVLGIIGLCLNLIFGLGFILSIISVIIARKAKKENNNLFNNIIMILVLLNMFFGLIYFVLSLYLGFIKI